MLDASATRLYLDEKGRICCSEPGRSKGKLCRKPILIGGRVADKSGHEFTLDELFEAQVAFGRDSVDDFLRRHYELRQGALADPLGAYRQIDGLVILDPEVALHGPKGENPLGLPDHWFMELIRRIYPMPAIWTPEVLAGTAKMCQTREWQCQPVLTLELPEVMGKAVTFEWMRDRLGSEHDGFGPGDVRSKDVLWTNWAIKQKHSCIQTPLTGGWRMYFQPTPVWVRENEWPEQQRLAKEQGLTIRSAPEYTWMECLWLANGLPRNPYWARTTTLCGSWPVDVHLRGHGVHWHSYCFPGNARSDIGAAVEGVPKLALAA